jgi:hypothetical protein
MSRASTPGHAISSAFSGGTSGISKALMDSRFVVGQTCPKHRALLEAPLQGGYTLDNAIEPCLPSRPAADHQRAVGVFSAFRSPSQAALPSSCRNAGMFSSRPPEHDPPSRGGALIKQILVVKFDSSVNIPRFGGRSDDRLTPSRGLQVRPSETKAAYLEASGLNGICYRPQCLLGAFL